MGSRCGKLHKGVQVQVQFFPNKCKALTNGHQNAALEMPQMQPLSSGKSLSDIKLLQMTLKKVHRCSYIPQKKSGSKPVSFNDSGVLGAWKTSATSKHFVSSERFWNGSVWHKLPEEAWDKFRRLNKVPDKFLQHAAIVVGNHLTCLFCVFSCVLEILFPRCSFSCYFCFDYVNQKGCFFVAVPLCHFHLLPHVSTPMDFLVVSVRVFSLFGFWTMPSSCFFVQWTWP